MSLDQMAREAGAEVRDRAAAIAPPSAGLIARRSRRGRAATAMAGFVGLAIAGLGVGVALEDDPAPTALEVTGDPEPTPLLGPGRNGWIAFDHDGDIYLLRSRRGTSEPARRLEVEGSGSSDDACPTWSPDGTLLAFGRLTGGSDTEPGDAELVTVPVEPDGAAGTPNVIPLKGFRALSGFDPHPCAIWAPDSRWVALSGNGDVWLADTDTGAVRRLPDLRPVDLDWRPGTHELAIAGDIGPDRSAETSNTPVTVYSVSTGETRQLGSVRAYYLTWSPDGSTLAYQGGEDDNPDELRLVDADGGNDRLLARIGSANHGVGPVWSPTGELILYQRLLGPSGERHHAALVDVADGTETVIDAPQTGGSIRSSWWPYSVTWSPDGTTLLYSAWSTTTDPSATDTSSTGVLAVPADAPTNTRLLHEGSSLTGNVYDHVWVPPQMWGRRSN